MDSTLFVIQILNGLQLGVLLFLLAAGLTLVFGIMDFINLAHGSFYMIGAFFCATLTLWLDSFLLAALLALPLTLVVGVVVELLVVRHLYQEDHLQQILATFGLILVADTLVHIIWGPEGLTFALPEVLNGQVTVLPGILFPVYRVLIISVGLLIAAGLYWVVVKTRVGMLIRAGASNRRMVEALGVDIRYLFTLVFGATARPYLSTPRPPASRIWPKMPKPMPLLAISSESAASSGPQSSGGPITRAGRSRTWAPWLSSSRLASPCWSAARVTTTVRFCSCWLKRWAPNPA